MSDPDVQLKLSKTQYLGPPKDSLLLRIATVPALGRDFSLYTKSLFIFDGPSLGRLNIVDDVRYRATWHQYGKISLRGRKQKIGAERVKHLTYAVLSAMGLSFIGNLFDLVYTFKTSQRFDFESDLVLNLYDEQEGQKRNTAVGTLSASAKKHYARTKEQRDAIKKFTGNLSDTTALPKRMLENLENYPVLSVSTKYAMPRKSVDYVLSLQRRQLSNEYKDPLLVMRTGVDISGLSSDHSHDVHRICSITQIHGYPVFVNSVDFPGPKYE
ncbi:MAG: hypothetical protein J4428_02920 [Candidatus Aenigmarchaeota archaeon]|nr:hypothetical protein [Candidatus Aenigmarchaeota archaeon]